MSSAKYQALHKPFNGSDGSGNMHERYARKLNVCKLPISSDETTSKTDKCDSSKRSSHTPQNNSWNEGNSTKHVANNLKMDQNHSGYNCIEESSLGNFKKNKTSHMPHNKQILYKNVDSSALMNKSEEKNNSKCVNSGCRSATDSSHQTGENAEECNFETNLEEKRRLRRERSKIKKEIRKQEKAVLREEEMRKKMLAPKDQKLTIIDQTTLKRFLEKNASPPTPQLKESVYNASEFPTLGEVALMARVPSKKYHKNENIKDKQNQWQDISSNAQIPSKSNEKAKQIAFPIDSSDQTKTSETSLCGSIKVISRNNSIENPLSVEETRSLEESKNTIKISEEKVMGKRPKRKDPIQLNISEIIKENKPEVPVKQYSSKTLPKTDVFRYSGNILDSDNPERKRGKQREIPKAKKPSNLKQIILQERARRKEIRLQETLIKANEIDNIENNENNICSNDIKFTDEQAVTYSQIENKYVEEKDNNARKLHAVNEINPLARVDSKNEIPPNMQIKFPTILNSNDTRNNGSQDTEQSEHEHKVLETSHRIDNIEEMPDSAHHSNSQIITMHQSSSHTPKIHSRKFRDYCDHCINPDILNFATALLEDIVKFHDRQFARSPLKASAKRRHITGLKEVRKFLALRKVRLLVIAPDLEVIPSAGGLDDIVTQLKEIAIANEVPYIFALSRRRLGYILKKKVPVSCVGILSYDGTEQNFHQLMTAVEKAREEYRLLVKKTSSLSTHGLEVKEAKEFLTVKEDVNEAVVASLLSKLSIPRNSESPTPFLEAIERCNSLEQKKDDELKEK